MKKKLYIIFTILLIMQTSVSLAGVADTKHNLSSGGSFTYKSDTESEVCKFCHTPHAAIADTPLWSHDLPTTTFTRFSSATLIADEGAGDSYGYNVSIKDAPGSSKLCMGCHDGVTALGALTTGFVAIDPSDYLTATDLRNKHPVSFEYQDSSGSDLLGALQAAKAGRYGLPNADGAPANNTIINPFVAEKWQREGQRIECTICHDPHTNNATDDVANLPFWVSSGILGYGSHDSVCVACHTPSFGEYTAFGEYSSL